MAGATAGALAGGTAAFVGYQRAAPISLEMDRGSAGVLHGVYDPERVGRETFAWTRDAVTFDLPSLDRRVPWACIIRLRGARPSPAALPDLVMAIDGVQTVARRVPNDYEDVAIGVPARPRQPGMVLTLRLSDTFQPSGGDRRSLGVMLDRVACTPAPGSVVRPPARAWMAATLATAVLGVAVALSGVAVAPMLLTIAVLAAALAWLVTRDLAPFGSYPTRLPWLAAWIGAGLLAATRLATWRAGGALQAAARTVLVISAGILCLKAAALLHPSKPLADAVFNAHRLTGVMAGGWYFTQPLASGLELPYAIGLYVFAAPWSAITANYVALLWILVAAVETAAGALLYLVVVRSWKDPWTGAAAVALFHMVPLTYGLMADANLPNLFAQQLALVTMAAIALWKMEDRAVRATAGVTLLAAAAFLSHISTFGLLTVTLLAVSALFRFRGGPAARVPARVVALATILAAALAVVLFYGHFSEDYARLGSLAGGSGDAASAPAAARAGDAASTASVVAPAPGRVARVIEAARLTAAVTGWPVLCLAAVGLWRVRRERVGGRLPFILGAWGIAFALFFAVGALAPVDPGNVRYAAEFVNRVVLATYPAAAVLGAVGLVWAWRNGAITRVAALVLALAALTLAGRAWLRWLD